MSAPLWLIDLTSAFWKLAGPPGPAPRDLRAAAQATGMMTVEDLPNLTAHAAADWLTRQNIPCPRQRQDAPLRACIVARSGFGFIFVNSDDPPAEQRFSIAHEVAHFLRDYWQPRRDAQRRLGPTALEVLDGHRPPRPEEKLHALFSRHRLGFFTHLMSSGGPDDPIAYVENDADRLAWELLAPARDLVLEDNPDRKSLQKRLVAEFGLPEAQAAHYANALVPLAPRPHPVLVRLFQAEK